MQRRPVNEHQLEVLRWVSAGCPDGVMKASSFKTSAIALRNRGLALVSKRGGWHASLTDAGRHYLERGTYPGEPAPKDPGPRRPTERAPLVEALPKKAIPDETDSIQIAESAAEPSPPPKPVRTIPVPHRLMRPHPIIAEARDAGYLAVSKNLETRALRIAHALAVAFENEGWAVRSRSKSVDRWGRAWSGRELFVVDTGEYRQGVYFGEENDRTEHVLTAYELQQKERSGYSYAPKFDYTPSGRLIIEIETWHRGRRQRWADRQRWNVEEKLGQIVDEIEVRARLEREDRLEREREEAERQVRIQSAVQEATLLMRESHRKDVFLAQVEQWHSTNRIREFLAAMEAAVAGLPDGDAKLEASDWMRWCQSCTSALDPLETALHFPEDPESSGDALRPFLPDWIRRGW